MDLGLQDRTVLLAVDDATDGEVCAFVLRREGAQVVVTSVTDAAGLAPGCDAVVVVLPVAPSSLLDAGLADLTRDWEQVEAVVAAFQAALPGMTDKRWGRLVTVVSGSVKSLDDDGADERGAVIGLAVLGLHKAAVADVARFGVTTNAVLRDEHTRPAELADTVAFLLSEPAGYLQGVTVALDGARRSSVF